jgi:hypothetical protein
MARSGLGRRQFLTGVGIAAAGVGGVGLSAVSGASGWTRVSTPTTKTLYDVARAADGAYAAGGSGTLLRRGDSGWEVVVGDGPTGQNKTLQGVDATDDGERVWVVGSSGRIGEYVTTTGTLIDHSKPGGMSSVLTDVSVTGTVGNERVFATKSAGEVFRGARNEKGGFDWTMLGPGGGYTVQGADFHNQTSGRVVTGGGQAVFETEDAGNAWTEVSPEAAQNTFYTVVSGPDRVFVGADTGVIWRLDCTCGLWTPHKPSGKAVRALERRNGAFLGAGESGMVYEFTDEGWNATDTGTGSVLLGVSPGSPDVAVGKGGVVVER